jgi:hypothetical protein
MMRDRYLHGLWDIAAKLIKTLVLNLDHIVIKIRVPAKSFYLTDLII